MEEILCNYLFENKVVLFFLNSSSSSIKYILLNTSSLSGTMSKLWRVAVNTFKVLCVYDMQDRF